MSSSLNTSPRASSALTAVAIIPARMGSSRFPGKPLAAIHGVPMIGHCFLRTRMCADLSGTYVATCDEEIAAYIRSIGGEAIMTARTHERCTDRTAEALRAIAERTGRSPDVVVMVQGDEPMVTPEMITAALDPFRMDPSVRVVNLMAPLAADERDDPNEVKVVVGANGDALYFSREPIPSWRKGATGAPTMKQVCVIPFRRDFLMEFNAMAEGALERVESVDMLRIIERGGRVRMVESPHVTWSVDTPEDLHWVEQQMASDALRPTYEPVMQQRHAYEAGGVA